MEAGRKRISATEGGAHEEGVTCSVLSRPRDSKLHLSQAAAKRGELTNLIAGVTGNVVIQLKVSNMLRAMPLLTLQYAISSMDKRGHILWPTTYEVRTAAALRKQLRFHLKTMMESDEYPTLEHMTPSLTASSETLLQLK